MAPSAAEVTVAHARHVASAKATDVASAKAADVASAKAAHVTSAKAADVASAKATHVTSAKAAAHVASATTTTVPSTTAAAGLRISSNKAAGKQCTCQDHHYSSSHDIFLWDGRNFPPQGIVRPWHAPGRQMPTSRWTEDGNAYLPSLLNSRSITRIENGAA
jgi:hypothetical protein